MYVWHLNESIFFVAHISRSCYFGQTRRVTSTCVVVPGSGTMLSQDCLTFASFSQDRLHKSRAEGTCRQLPWDIMPRLSRNFLLLAMARLFKARGSTLAYLTPSDMRLLGLSVGLCVAHAVLALPSNNSSVLVRSTPSSSGTNNGYYYTFLNYGNDTYINGPGGQFTLTCSGNSYDSIGGKGWNPGSAG